MENFDGENQLRFLVGTDDPWVPKDTQVTMEHPFFSLSKNADCAIREYEHNGLSITVTPSQKGMPTVWDNEILIYCCSQIVKAINEGRKPSRVLRTTAHTLLKETNRSIGIRGYHLLEKSLGRLAGVRINTNIQTGDERTRQEFGFINEWIMHERQSTHPRMDYIEITLSEWLYRAVLNMEVLTLNVSYFKIKGGIERRIYELCRKHCGEQQEWKISISLLHKKSGSLSPLKLFKFNLSKIVAKNEIPDYQLLLKGDTLHVYYAPQGGDIEQIVAIRSVLDGLSDYVGQ